MAQISKENPGIMTLERLSKDGPFIRGTKNGIIYTIAASNEAHGSALPSNIDEKIAIATAFSASKQTGFTYRGHIPYSTDYSDVAKYWNPDYIPQVQFVDKVLQYISEDLNKLKSGSNIRASSIALIGGHGGNDQILNSESLEIEKRLGIPFIYLPPFPEATQWTHPKYGKIFVSHADLGEHSIALYLEQLDVGKLAGLNKNAAVNPRATLLENPPLVSLTGFVLPESGPIFEPFREMRKKRYPATDGIPPVGVEFMEKRVIIADYKVGRDLVELNNEVAVKAIKELARK
jgi:creatinine amidohydrolase/Fe(II)-dependent formamide hydrolase-like protein